MGSHPSSRRRLLLAYGVVPLVPVAATVALFFGTPLHLGGGGSSSAHDRLSVCPTVDVRGQRFPAGISGCSGVRPRTAVEDDHPHLRFSIRPVPVIR
jgi:hypothetical protein